MRLLALVAIIACDAGRPPQKQVAVTPSKPAVSDPWHVPAGSGAVGSAGDPKWAKDPPAVLFAKINGVNAHVIVLKSTASFAEYRDVLATAEKTPGVVAAEPFIFAELEIAKAGKPPVSLALKAVDPARVDRVLAVGRHMKTGTFALAKGEPPPIVLGDSLAKTLDVRIGDAVTLIPPKDASTSKPRVFRVTGTYFMDFDEYDERLAFAALPAVQTLLGRGDDVMGVEMVVEDIARADDIAKAIEDTLGGPPYEAMDWYELNQNLFTALGHARP
jgi:lipoprotein-releasing system permease protein